MCVLLLARLHWDTNVFAFSVVLLSREVERERFRLSCTSVEKPINEVVFKIVCLKRFMESSSL